MRRIGQLFRALGTAIETGKDKQGQPFGPDEARAWFDNLSRDYNMAQASGIRGSDAVQLTRARYEQQKKDGRRFLEEETFPYIACHVEPSRLISNHFTLTEEGVLRTAYSAHLPRQVDGFSQSLDRHRTICFASDSANCRCLRHRISRRNATSKWRRSDVNAGAMWIPHHMLASRRRDEGAGAMWLPRHRSAS